MPDVLDQTQELDPVDAGFYDDYTQAAATGGALPPDGAYTVRFPDPIPESAFVVKRAPANQGGRKYLEIGPLDLTIVGGPHDGYVARYIRFDTKPIPEFKREGANFVPTGKTLNASDAADLILNFGTGAKPQTKAEWQEAIQRLAGQVTPSPVYFAWGGYDKKASGKAKYLKSKDFPKAADGTRPTSLERTDPATGEVYKVFANLRLGRRGFAPKSV